MPALPPTLQISRARLPATTEICIVDEYGDSRQQAIAAERALTVYLNKREIVTLMTLGDDPEATRGYCVPRLT